MKTIYIEHSYLVNEKNWPEIRKFFADNPDSRLVLSDWNVIEISQASDKVQARRRVDFIEGLSPIWLINKTEVQKREIRSFLYRYHYGSIAPYSIFTDQFHKTVGVCIGSEPNGGWKLWGFVESYIDNPDALAPIQAQKSRYIESSQALIGADKTDIKKKEAEIVGRWIKDILPDKKPDGGQLSDADKRQAIDFCLSNMSKFCEECPHLNFESVLFDVRFADKNRPPRKSDAIDLEHVCCSVPYCDAVVIGDRYLRVIAEKASSLLNMGRVVSCLSEL